MNVKSGRISPAALLFHLPFCLFFSFSLPYLSICVFEPRISRDFQEKSLAIFNYAEFEPIGLQKYEPPTKVFLLTENFGKVLFK